MNTHFDLFFVFLFCFHLMQSCQFVNQNHLIDFRFSTNLQRIVKEPVHAHRGNAVPIPVIQLSPFETVTL